MSVFWVAQFLLWGAVFSDARRVAPRPIDLEPITLPPFPNPRPRPSCLNMFCEKNQLCVMDNGRPRCVTPVVGGVCTASGDPHFCTFDNFYYDFMGTCTYTFATVCGKVDGLPLFTIRIKNDNRGNVGVSYVGEVTLLIGPHAIVVKKDEFAQIRVDNALRSLPVSLMSGVLKASQIGNSVLMQMGDYMKLSYDWSHFLWVEISGQYVGKMCGMCGNFNQNPKDDLQTPERTLAPDAIAFGSSWKVEDNTDCWNDCGKYCVSCPADSAKKYSTVDYCGLINKKDGPFSECNAIVEPKRCMENCIYDVCVHGGFKKIFCDAVQAYAETCQRAGVAIKEWRKAAGCPLKCPMNSTYVLCDRACPATCEDPEAKTLCTRPCVESCQCNPGFVKSEGKCIPKARCGCSHNGFTYAPNQVFWNDNACKQRCVCNEKTREVECTDSPCKVQEECAVRNGIRNCYPRSYGVCTANGDPHYITFDGTQYNFQGTCVYQFTGVCDPNPDLVDFKVWVKNRKIGNSGVSSTDKVYIKVYGMEIEASALYPNKVKIDNVLINLPYMSVDGKISIYLSSSTANFWFDFGLTVTYNYNNVITVTVPGTYANNLCGLCGNFNGDPRDDLKPKDGPSPTDPITFGTSWKVREEFGCRDDWNEECNDFEAEKERQMDPGSECGVMMSTKFRDCFKRVDPKPYFDFCVFDKCILRDRQAEYCSVITSYVQACQRAGGTIDPWRTRELCPISCPSNSHYEICADPCPVTCNGLSTPKGCDGNCTEGCKCNNGFVLSGDQCVPISECGCNHNGTYYSLGESVYDGESCERMCSCTEGGVMTCIPWYCSRTDECRKQNGVLGCFSRFSATCTAGGYSHYRTFDDLTYNFGGYCSYVLAESKGDMTEGVNLPAFRVTVKRDKRDSSSGSVISVTVEAHEMTLTLNRGENEVIQVNGENNWLPVTLMSGNIIAENNDQGVIITIDGIILVTFTCDFLVSVTVPGNYMGAIYGLCGNYNGLPEDDTGRTPEEISAIGNKWKVDGEPDECEGCGRKDNPCPPCRDEKKKILLQSKYCGIINDPTGPLAKCRSFVDPESYVNGCVSDLCQTNGEDSSAAFSYASMYANACRNAGFKDLTWRREDSCPVFQ